MRMEWAVNGGGDGNGSGVTAEERSTVAEFMLSNTRVVSISQLIVKDSLLTLYTQIYHIKWQLLPIPPIGTILERTFWT